MEETKSSPADPESSGQGLSVDENSGLNDADEDDDLEILDENSLQNDDDEVTAESTAVPVSAGQDETSRSSEKDEKPESVEDQISRNLEMDESSQNADVVQTSSNPKEDESGQNVGDETSQSAESDKVSVDAEVDETSRNADAANIDEASQDVVEVDEMSPNAADDECFQNSTCKTDETSQPAATEDESSVDDESTRLSSSQDEPAQSKEDVVDDNVNAEGEEEDVEDNLKDSKGSPPSLTQVEEDKLLAEETGDENSSDFKPGEENSKILNQEKDDGMGLQISAVTGGDEVMEVETEDKDSEKKSVDIGTDKKEESMEEANDDVVAMDTEESGGLPKMVISEPRTISEENMEVVNVEGETTETKETESSSKMEVDEKEGGNKKMIENGDAESSSASKVENLISENDSAGFKIVSVSEAKDAREEITIDDDSEKKVSCQLEPPSPII